MAVAGAAVLLVSLLWSLLLGRPALTHAHGVLPLLSWKWHTALLFDVGVVLAVAGGVAAASRALWSSTKGAAPAGAGRVDP